MFKVLTSVFAFIIALGLGTMYIKPTLMEIKSTQNELREFQEAIENADQLRAAIDERTNQIQSIDPVAQSRLEAMVPDSVNKVRVIMNLDALAVKHKMSFANVQVREKESSETAPFQSEISNAEEAQTGEGVSVKQYLEPFEVTFELVGNYESFLDFLTEMEQSLEYFDIAGIDFETPTGDLFKFQVTVRTYTFAYDMPQAANNPEY